MAGLPRAVDGGEDAPEGSQVDVVIHAHAEDVVSVLVPQLDIGHGHGIRALGNGVLFIVHKGEAVHFLAVNGVEEGVDGAVAFPGDLKNGVGVAQGPGEADVGLALIVNTFLERVLQQLIGRSGVDVILLEELEDASEVFPLPSGQYLVVEG